jgi:hypothetical protein
MPLIIDDTRDVEFKDANIKADMKYTIIILETDKITSINEGCMTLEDFCR